VVALGHGGWQADEWRQWGISRWHACDITASSLQRHAGEVDAVVHCAGAGDVAFSSAHPLESFARTVSTTADVLELMRLRLPHAALVLVSSAAVYGDTAGGPISEEHPVAPISAYGVHKQMAEQLSACYARMYALRVSVLRLFSIYGPGLRKQLLWDACNKLTRGTLSFAGTGAELRDWLHVSDAVALVAKVLQDAAAEPYRLLNGGTGAGASVSQVLQELAAALDGKDGSAYDPGVIPQLGPVEVLPGIWAANLDGARFSADDFAVVSLCRLGEPFPHTVHRMAYVADDEHNTELDAVLTDILEDMAALRAEGHKLLVHCHGGASRTGLVLRGWLIREKGLSVEEATSHVADRWPYLGLWNDSFTAALHRLAAGTTAA